MAITPTSTQQVDSTSSALTSLVSTAITVNNGDILVVKTVSEDVFCAIGAVTGGSQTWTARGSSTTSSNCGVTITTCVVSGSPGTVTVTQAFSGSARWRSMTIERWVGCSLAATPATNATKTGSGAPSTTVTTTGTGSAVTWANGDWNANAPGTPAYRSSATQEGIHNKSTGNYVAYYAYQQAAAAGAQTMGMTLPSGQQWALIGIEILDAGGGGTNHTASPADTAGVSDAASVVIDAARAPADLDGITDAATRVLDAARAPADLAGITDAVALERSLPAADIAGLLDAAAAVQDVARAPADSVGASDAATAVQDAQRAPSDTIGANDAAAAVLDALRGVSDLAGILDAAAATADSDRGPGDGAGIGDSVTIELELQRIISDSIGIVDDSQTDFAGSGSQNLGDSAGIGDAVSTVMTLERVVIELEGLSDSVTVELTGGAVDYDIVVHDAFGLLDARSITQSGDELVTVRTLTAIPRTRTLADVPRTRRLTPLPPED